MKKLRTRERTCLVQPQGFLESPGSQMVPYYLWTFWKLVTPARESLVYVFFNFNPNALISDKGLLLHSFSHIFLYGKWTTPSNSTPCNPTPSPTTIRSCEGGWGVLVYFAVRQIDSKIILIRWTHFSIWKISTDENVVFSLWKLCRYLCFLFIETMSPTIPLPTTATEHELPASFQRLVGSILYEEIDFPCEFHDGQGCRLWLWFCA